MKTWVCCCPEGPAAESQACAQTPALPCGAWRRWETDLVSPIFSFLPCAYSPVLSTGDQEVGLTQAVIGEAAGCPVQF